MSPFPFFEWKSNKCFLNLFKSGILYALPLSSTIEIIYRSDLDDSKKIAEHTEAYEDRFLNPFVAAERGYVDDVIMPHNSRNRIIKALKMLRNKKLSNPWKKHDNLPL